ncbi:MAG: hypothetical protein RR404_04165, partial [Bacilli bacterium]
MIDFYIHQLGDRIYSKSYEKLEAILKEKGIYSRKTLKEKGILPTDSPFKLNISDDKKKMYYNEDIHENIVSLFNPNHYFIEIAVKKQIQLDCFNPSYISFGISKEIESKLISINETRGVSMGEVQVEGAIESKYISCIILPVSSNTMENNTLDKLIKYICDICTKNAFDLPIYDYSGKCLYSNKNQNEIQKSDSLFVEQKNPFNANGPVYAFSNEALSQYMSNYDFSEKKVLTSLGSGDFTLNAYLLGAKQVDSFDINQYTFYFYDLKRALIMNYDYISFCNLIKKPSIIFEKFDEYKKYLTADSINFFEKLNKMYNGNFNEMIKKIYIDKVGEEKNQYNESNTFNSFEELFLTAQYKNYYLQSETNFNALKSKLKDATAEKFYFEDLYSFTPPEKYDVVYLSNIGDYSKSENEFIEFVMSMRDKILNENG